VPSLALPFVRSGELLDLHHHHLRSGGHELLDLRSGLHDELL
jgi:hypothetical protein